MSVQLPEILLAAVDQSLAVVLGCPETGAHSQHPENKRECVCV